MNKIIAVEKINISSLIDNKIKESKKDYKVKSKIKQSKIEKLTPFIAQALFGVVEIHNKLLSIGKKGLLNQSVIEDASLYVSNEINNKSNWKNKIEDINSILFTNVSFQNESILIWCSDNVGGAKYTNNYLYQIYSEKAFYNVEGFLKYLINKNF